MLCYVMLCYVMLCYVMLCYAMLCYVMLCYVMLCQNLEKLMVAFETAMFTQIQSFHFICHKHVKKFQYKLNTVFQTDVLKAKLMNIYIYIYIYI